MYKCEIIKMLRQFYIQRAINNMNIKWFYTYTMSLKFENEQWRDIINNFLITITIDREMSGWSMGGGVTEHTE